MTLSVVIVASKQAIQRQSYKRAVESVGFVSEVITINAIEPITDFAASRSQGLTRATGEWVLFLDSDEVVSPALASEIKRVMSEEKNFFNGFRLKRRDRFLGAWLKHGESQHIKFLRLARRSTGHWERPVHEVWSIPGKIGCLKQPLLHDSHATVDSMLGKIDWYTNLEANSRRRRWSTSLEMVIFPIVKFGRNYFFRLGLLDGIPGFIQAAMMSWHSFLVRAKVMTGPRFNESSH